MSLLGILAEAVISVAAAAESSSPSNRGNYQLGNMDNSDIIQMLQAGAASAREFNSRNEGK